MQKQGDSLEAQHVFDLVHKEVWMDILAGKWVFDEKLDPETRKWEARARWVVCSNFEDGAWDMVDVYAAVANSVSVRTFAAIVAVQDLECRQFDFKAAFLNAHIPKEDEYYVEQPHGLSKGEHQVWRLRKALYGLKRSPLYWFQTLIPVMKDLGFTPMNTDVCLFVNRVTGAILVLYVDDMLIAANTTETIDEIRDGLQRHFQLKDLGEARRFLGFDIIRDRENRTIFLSQESFTRAMLHKYGFTDLSPANTPWPSKFVLPVQWTALETDRKAYVKKTGSLNWLSTGTRPDISFTVSKLCEANRGPSEQHISVSKHLFRYLVGTVTLGILLGGKLPITNLKLRAFADASFADDLLTRYSTGAHVVFIAGGPVLWKTKKQTFVAASTTEAEFTNLSPAGQSAQWVARILAEYGAPQPAPILLYTDSNNARLIVMNPLNTARTRCVDIRYKWIIDRVQKKELVIEHISGTEMAADGLTKPLLREKHQQFVRMLGMVAQQIPWAKAHSGMEEALA
jgi:hypothetical protein